MKRKIINLYFLIFISNFNYLDLIDFSIRQK